MIKSIIKEIIIFLLLLISIALLLGILLYDYIPNTRTIPTKQVLQPMPTYVKEELASSLQEEKAENLETKFYINDADLRQYEKANQYDKGKINPFEKYTAQETQPPGNGGNTPGNNTGGNNTGGNNTGNNVGNFYENK